MKVRNVDARYYNLCLFIMWALFVATSMIAICTESIILLYVMVVIFIVLTILFIGKKGMMLRSKWGDASTDFDYQLAGFVVIWFTLISVALYDEYVFADKKYVYDFAMASPAYLLIYLMLGFDH